MGLREQINDSLKEAMKAKDQKRRRHACAWLTPP